MPYLTRDVKDSLNDIKIVLSKTKLTNPGELNYLFTLICIQYLDNKREINGHVGQYQAYNDVLGALEGAKLELYRRSMAPYEDIKILENGDVYANRS